MTQTGEIKVERLDAIRSHLYANGFSTINAIARSVGASVATIRRDLQKLEREGAVDRVHGGARIAEGSSVEVAFQERARTNLAAKRAIAAAAFEKLASRSSLFLDAGTTVLQLARLIRINPLPLRIFTNGLPVAQELSNLPQIEVTLLGGQLRSENSSVVGPHAEAMLQSLWLDQLFLGASAIGEDGAIYSVDSAEASLNRCMLSRSAQRFILADASKFGCLATYKVAPLSEVHAITDSKLSPEWRHRLRQVSAATTIVETGVAE